MAVALPVFPQRQPLPQRPRLRVVSSRRCLAAWQAKKQATRREFLYGLALVAQILLTEVIIFSL